MDGDGRDDIVDLQADQRPFSPVGDDGSHGADDGGVGGRDGVGTGRHGHQPAERTVDWRGCRHEAVEHPRTEDDHCGQGSGTTGGMNHGRAGEVDKARSVSQPPPQTQRPTMG